MFHSPFADDLCPALPVCVEPVQVLVHIYLVPGVVTELTTIHDQLRGALQVSSNTQVQVQFKPNACGPGHNSDWRQTPAVPAAC